MFKALLGGGRSSSDVRSSSSSKSSTRRRANSKSSTVSRKSSRGDDRDRGLGDLSTYRSSSSRTKRYAPSLAGESVASSYATADQDIPVEPDRFVIERAPRRQDSDDTIRRDQFRDNGDEERKSSRRRERVRSPSRERERTRTDRDDRVGEAISRDRDGGRPERRRTQSGDRYASPVTMGIPTSGPEGNFTIAGPQPYPPVTAATPTTSMPSPPHATAFYDPHVPQQFPGQFPAYVAEPYRPPHPAGEAAEYYGDQGQSVQDQPGVRPKPPLVTPSDQAHLMSASPVANPPPEPSSMGQVGAAAAYYTDDADLEIEQTEQSSSASAPKPPKPAKPSKPRPPRPSVQTTGISGPPAEVATTAPTAAATELSEHTVSESPSTYVPPSVSSPQNPSHSQGVGAAVGAAAAGAAAGYLMSHHHQSSVSADHASQYTLQNYEEVSQNGPAYPDPQMYPPQPNPTAFAAGPAAAAAAAGYAASPLHPHHAAVYHGAPFQSGGLAFQQRQRGPLDKFIEFWRDTEGVGMFEDYTETIGICQHCFDPGSTSRDAPRRHNHTPRRRSADRYSNGSRVDKASRYTSSEDEGRRRKRSPSNSWLPGLLGGIAVKSIFSNKEFDETYSIRSGRVASSRHSLHGIEGVSTSSRRSQTSRGVYRRSHRSQSRERTDHSSYHSDSKLSRYEQSRVRSRSRSRSSSRAHRHAALRDAALDAAVETAVMSEYESRHRSRSRSPSPRQTRGRKTSSSDNSFVDISRPARKSVGGAFSSFFTASSENRRKRRTKRRRSIFSFHNSSSSSLDADLAFGTGYARRQPGKSNRRSKKKTDEDVDAALLGLGATATALVTSSERSRRRTGEILAGKESRSGRSDYESSAANDEGWEDLDSGDQSSPSVSSGLAFGGSGLFPSTDSHSSDSGTSKWTWGWGSKKTKKKKKKRRSRSSDKRFPTEAAVAAGLGTAALASVYHQSTKASSQDATSDSGSLQHVAPVPTSDPSRFDAINVSSLPPAQPTLVRPGPIPLQQPQPVTRVSQSVYATQGESIHAYSAPDEPATPGSAFMPYETQVPHTGSDRWNQRSEDYVERNDISSRINRSHRRSDSSPVLHTEPLESMPTSSIRRRSTLKDQASVQFDLTEEQADKERRTSHRTGFRRDGERREGVQLVDREQEMALQDAGRQASRQREREYEKSRTEEDYSRKERDSSSWIGAAAATVLSGQSSNDAFSETASQRRHEERREKRRAERRRVSESESISSNLPMSEAGKAMTEERSQLSRQPEVVRTPPSRQPPRRKPAKPVYEDYAQFFAPEELRYSPDTYARREPASMPTIIEVEPAHEDSVVTEEPHPDYSGLPWPVPGLTLTEPTPPQSLVGSARASPITLIPERVKEASRFERQTTSSRVSWGKHEMHEYEVPSTSSELESVDQDTRDSEHREVERIAAENVQEFPTSSSTDPLNKDIPSIVGADIEFAAALAAATAAAGFDPSLVTDNPTYHTRSSPSMPEPKVKFVSPWDEMSVSRTVPHGFIEGEVETPGDERAPVAPDHLIENGPFFAEPESLSGAEIVAPAQQSIAQEVIEHLSRRRERDTNDRFDSQRGLESVSEGERIESPEEVLSMPGGFEPEEPSENPKELRDPTRPQGDHPSSIITAFEARTDAASTTQDRSDQSSSDLEANDDTNSSAVGGEAVEGKKKRRKRRSKRKSDHSEDVVSTISSPATYGETSDKRRSTDENVKETKPGGFLSNLFGSRISEPVESKRASSADRRSSRAVQSEVGSRRREKSSRRRSSSRGDALDDENRAVEDKENINVEHYKSSRQRREERRRQRYEDMMESGKPLEFEKEREQLQDDEQRSFLAEGPEMPGKVDEGDDHGASGRLESEVTGLGLVDVLDSRPRSRSASLPPAERAVDPAPTSRSRPTSPEMARYQEENQGLPSRRSSVVRSTESPTAVPLHFRRPPTSPRVNRSPSLSSTAAPSPGSPTQGRRRPASTEFKNSREIRPLWLVERFGTGKADSQPDEPLPSLPSSKTSSANASLEELRALPDDTRWEMVDLSHHVRGPSQPSDTEMSLTQNQFGDEYPYDVLGSDQGTPTAATFGQTYHHPPARKEKLNYEFHSPSELLQDPPSYPELPPSPTMAALPSVEGSAVGVKDEADSERVVEAMPSLPEMRPSTPEDKLPHINDIAETTPTQGKTHLVMHALTSDVESGFIEGADAVPADDSVRIDILDSEKQAALDKQQRAEDGKETPRTTVNENILGVEDAVPDSLTLEKDRSTSPIQDNAPTGLAAIAGAAVTAAIEKIDPSAELHTGSIDLPTDDSVVAVDLTKKPESLHSGLPSDEQGPSAVIAKTGFEDIPANAVPAPLVYELDQGKTDAEMPSIAENAQETSGETEKHWPGQGSPQVASDASDSAPDQARKSLDEMVQTPAGPGIESEEQEKPESIKDDVIGSSELIASHEIRSTDQEIATQPEEPQVDESTPVSSRNVPSEAGREGTETVKETVTVDTTEPTSDGTNKAANRSIEAISEELGISVAEATPFKDVPAGIEEQEADKASAQTELKSEVPMNESTESIEAQIASALSERMPEAEQQEKVPIKTEDAPRSTEPTVDTAADSTRGPVVEQPDEPSVDATTPSASKKKNKKKRKKKGQSVDLGAAGSAPPPQEPTAWPEDQMVETGPEAAQIERVAESETREPEAVQQAIVTEPTIETEQTAESETQRPVLAEEQAAIAQEPSAEAVPESTQAEKDAESGTQEPEPVQQAAVTEGPRAENAPEPQVSPVAEEPIVETFPESSDAQGIAGSEPQRSVPTEVPTVVIKEPSPEAAPEPAGAEKAAESEPQVAAATEDPAVETAPEPMESEKAAESGPQEPVLAEVAPVVEELVAKTAYESVASENVAESGPQETTSREQAAVPEGSGAEIAPESAGFEEAVESEPQLSKLAEPTASTEEPTAETSIKPTEAEKLEDSPAREELADATEEASIETAPGSVEAEKVAESEPQVSPLAEQTTLTEESVAEDEMPINSGLQEKSPLEQVLDPRETAIEIEKPTEPEPQASQLGEQVPVPDEYLAENEQSRDSADPDTSAIEHPAEAGQSNESICRETPAAEQPTILEEEPVLEDSKTEEPFYAPEPQKDAPASEAAPAVDVSETLSDATVSSKKAKKKKRKSKNAAPDLSIEGSSETETAKEPAVTEDQTEIMKPSEGLEAAKLVEEASIEEKPDTSDEPKDVETKAPLDEAATAEEVNPSEEPVETTMENPTTVEVLEPSEEGVNLEKADEAQSSTPENPDEPTVAHVPETSLVNTAGYVTEAAEENKDLQSPEEATAINTELASTQREIQDTIENVAEPNEHEAPPSEREAEDTSPSADVENKVPGESPQEVSADNEVPRSESVALERETEQLRQDEGKQTEMEAGEEHLAKDTVEQDVTAAQDKSPKDNIVLADLPASIDQAHPAPEPTVMGEVSQPAPVESEPSLSRTSSRKKKKNKRKSNAEASPVTEQACIPQLTSAESVPEVEAEVVVETQAATETEAVPETEAVLEADAAPETEAAREAEAVPDTGTEPAAARDEGPELKLPEEARDKKNKEPSHEPEAEGNETLPVGSSAEDPQTGDLVEDVREDVREDKPEETVGKQSKKKSKKNKKNRKSSGLTDPQPEPPEASQEDSAESPLLQTSGEVPSAAAQGEPEEPQPMDVAEEALAEPLADATVPTTISSPSTATTLPVEKLEANDNAPHVPDQSAVEPEPGPDLELEAGSSTPTGKKSKKPKKKRQSQPATSDESPTPAQPSLDNTDPTIAIAEAPLAAEKTPAPADQEQEQQEPIQDPETVDATGALEEQTIEAPAPMTAAQRKKAKKEKKKQQKQPPESINSTPASESVAVPEDAPTAELPSEEPSTLLEPAKVELTTNHKPIIAEELALEQSKDAAAEETASAIPIALPPGALPESTTVGSTAVDEVTTENTESAHPAGEQFNDLAPTETEPQPSTNELSEPYVVPAQDQHIDATEGSSAAGGVGATESKTLASETQDAMETALPSDEPLEENAESTDPAEEMPEPSSEEPLEEGNAAEGGFPSEQVSEADTAAIEVAEPQNDIATSIEATQEEVPADVATKDRGDEASIAGVGLQEPIQEDVQTSSTTKSKKEKKKKKKRQSITIDEAQPAPAQEDDSIEAVPEADNTLIDTSENVDTSAVADDIGKSDDTLEQAEEEVKELDNQLTEPVQEAHTPMSKKKAKKDRKKRKSVSFAAEEPTLQSIEPSDAVVDASETPEQGDVVKPGDSFLTEPEQDTTDDGVAELQQTEPASMEPVEEMPALSEESQAIVTPAPGPRDDTQQSIESTAEDQVDKSEDQLAPQEEHLPSTDVDPTQEAPGSDSNTDASVTLKEAGESSELEPDAGVAGTVETLQTESSPKADIAQSSITETDPQSATGNAEQEPGSSNSKKKKKKKKKKKSTNGEAIEDADAATPDPGINNAPSEPVTPVEPDAPAEPETAVEPETRIDSTVLDVTESKESEETAQPPEKLEDDFPPMSAKARKKAKKEKRRQSKILADAVESAAELPKAAAAEETLDASEVQLPSETTPAEPSLETAHIPAEDDGKDNQSHGTENHGKTDEDMIWTDDMVSPQVEQEQATSSAYPPQLEPEKSEGGPVPLPSDEGHISAELDANVPNQTESSTVNEVKESGDVHEDVVTKPAENMENANYGTGALSIQAGGEFSSEENEPEAVDRETKDTEQPPIEDIRQNDEKAANDEQSLSAEGRKGSASDVPDMGAGTSMQPSGTTQETVPIEQAPEIISSTTDMPSKKRSRKEKKKQRQAQRAANIQEPEQSAATQDNEQATDTVPPDDLTKSTAASTASVLALDAPLGRVASQTNEDAATSYNPEPIAAAEGQEDEMDVLNGPPIESHHDDNVHHSYPATTMEFPKEDTPEESSIPEAGISEFAEADSLTHAWEMPIDPVAKKKKNRREGSIQAKEKSEPQEVVEVLVQSEAAPDNQIFDSREVTETPPEQPYESGECKDKFHSIRDDAVLEERPSELAAESGLATSYDKSPGQTPDALKSPAMLLEQTSPDKELTGDYNIIPSAAETTTEASREMVEEETPPETPLIRKESKKKKKKAKKQAKEEQDAFTLTPAEGTVAAEKGVDDWTDIPTFAQIPAEEPSNIVEEAREKEWEGCFMQDGENKEQFETPQVEEAADITAEGSSQLKEVPVVEGHAVLQQEYEGKVNTEPATEALEEKDGPETVEELPEMLPEQAHVALPLTKKPSKEERRKAKQTAEEELVESANQPQPEVEAGAADDLNLVQEQVTESPDTLAAEQPKEASLPSRSLSRKAEKKKRKGNQSLDGKDPGSKPSYKQDTSPSAQTAGTLAWEQRAQDDDSWPTIDWEKSQVDSTEQSPDSSPEARPIPFEPGIAEFDESATPEGVTRRMNVSAAVRKAKHARPFQQKRGEKEQAPSEATDGSPGHEVETQAVLEEGTTTHELASEHTVREMGSSALSKPSTESLGADSHQQSKIASIFPELERGFFRRPTLVEASGSAKDGAEEETIHKGANRDSENVLEAPIATTADYPSSAQGDVKPTEQGHSEESASIEPELHPTPVEPVLEVEADPSYNVSVLSDGPNEEPRQIDIRWGEDKDKETPEDIEAEAPRPNLSTHHEAPLYAPLPMHERQSVLVRSSPRIDTEIEQQPSRPSPTCELRRSPSIHGRHNQPLRPWSLEVEPSTQARTPSPQPPQLEGSPGVERETVSPPRTPLQTIDEDEPRGRAERSTGARTVGHGRGTPRLEMKPEHVLPRPETPVRKFTANALARQAWPTPDKDTLLDETADVDVKKRRPESRVADSAWPAEGLRTPEQGKPVLWPSSVRSVQSIQELTRSLRRSSRSASGDLRAAASQGPPGDDDQSEPKAQPPASSASDLNLERIASSSSYDPVTDKGKRPLRTMTDVYEGWGETPSSPRSPSRPPSVRHRRSMQHLQELESRLDRLISENRLLAAARDEAEDKLRNVSVARRKSDHALNNRDADLRDRAAEVEQLKSSLEWFQKEVARLTEENEGLANTSSNLTATHAQEVQVMQDTFNRQVDELRSQNQQLSAEMHDRVRQEVDAALAQKDMELRRLREDLETARDKVKQLQQQIAAAMQDDVLVFRDEDYFDAACQKLCGHVQQWVLRFSKHSDHRRCRKLGDLQDEKIADRFDNAILDGSDADAYLADRVRRRDVFMSVVMTMVWEFIFTRYLFGMDREQRQKLKSLEKQLADIGPRSAIHRWRATTLTLLSKRPTFSKQRESDTEAVALEIFDTLSRLLPPPTNVEAQLLDSLRKVLRVAVHLSIEMRTQLAEYIMLPPLQPEYDTNGDLARQVYFNASLMNERSGETISNDVLESQQAVVRVVLFPLVVKKGNDRGEGDDEVVVCPAQVLIARPNKDKKVVKMLSGDRMSLDTSRSVHSIAPSSTMDMSNVI